MSRKDSHLIQNCVQKVLVKPPVLEDRKYATRSSACIRAANHVGREIYAIHTR